MIRIGVNPGQWGWRFDQLEQSWQQAEQLGFGAVSCFDHVTAPPRGWAAWEAASLLTAVALRTEHAAVCVNVIDVCLRHPFLLAGQLAVAQAASRGRLEVGLGIGADHLAPHDFRALGRAFPARAERMAVLSRLLEVLPVLWRGEAVTDRKLGLHEASLGPLGISIPPLIVGGRSGSVLELAARHADGWNVVVEDARRFASLSDRLDSVCATVGRRRPLARTAQLFVPRIELANARRLVRDLGEAGADTVLFVLPDPGHPEALNQVATAVLE